MTAAMRASSPNGPRRRAGVADQAAGSVLLDGADEVMGASQVEFPDLVLFGGAEHRGEVDDRDTPATAAVKESGSRRSPPTATTSGGTFLSGRTSARQSTRASTRRVGSRGPTRPVPPVTRMVMRWRLFL